jgi:hypothetical protein
LIGAWNRSRPYIIMVDKILFEISLSCNKNNVMPFLYFLTVDPCHPQKDRFTYRGCA